MSIDIQKLLCCPTGLERSHTLDAQLLQEFLNAGLVIPEQLMATNKHTPLWMAWFEGNGNKKDASHVLTQVLPQIPGFSWTEIVNQTALTPKSPLDFMGQYLSEENLNSILSSLTPDQLNNLQRAPLTTAQDFGLKKMVCSKREDLCDILVNKGWDVNIQSQTGSSLLMDCTDWKQARLVLKYKPNVEVIDQSGNTILDCVRKWSIGEDFEEILKVINSHRVHVPSSAFGKSKEKLFEIIARQKVAELKKNLKSLCEIETSEPLEDSQNRSPLFLVCENLRCSRNKSAQGAYTRFFIRFLNAFIPEIKKRPDFGKDKPLHTMEKWSEFDHTMMVLLVNTTRTSSEFPSDLISDDIKTEIETWSTQRLPQLHASLDAWVKEYLNDYSVGSSYQDRLASNRNTALNFCSVLVNANRTTAQNALFEQLACLTETSETFSHLLADWIKEGSAPENKFNQRVFRSQGVGSFACLWALNNNVTQGSALEKSLVLFAFEYISTMTSRHSSSWADPQSPVLGFIETKLQACANNHPQLRDQWLNNLKQESKYKDPYLVPTDFDHRMSAALEKIVLSINLAEELQMGKVCQRKI